MVFGRGKSAELASPLRCNRVAVTVQSHRRYGVIASPLRCYRVAVTVQSRRDCPVTAKLFGRKAIGGAAKGHLEAVFPL